MTDAPFHTYGYISLWQTQHPQVLHEIMHRWWRGSLCNKVYRLGELLSSNIAKTIHKVTGYSLGLYQLYTNCCAAVVDKASELKGPDTILTVL